MLDKYTFRHICGFLICSAGFTVSSAQAYSLRMSDLSLGYSNCSYTDNGNGTVSAKVTISYKDVAGHLGPATFMSRGIMTYAYGDQGEVIQLPIAQRVFLNGTRDSGYSGANGYTMYYNGNTNTTWKETGAFLANIEVVINKSRISKWPAVGVRAGNFTSYDDVGEISGFAYISAVDNGGTCRVLSSPEVTPPTPADTKIMMTAPDWHLGELPRGKKNEKTFSAPKEQLCFTYNGAPYVTKQKYMINATSENGLSGNNRYLLKNLEDSSYSIPYSVTLNSGSASVSLPNVGSRFISISKVGRMCFVPTFQTDVDKAAKSGAYSDILTFTVVAKP